MVGLWAQLHSDESPVLAVDFYLANRRVYRELSRQLVSQYPAHLDRFDQDYLILPDGQCALPAAYTLAYGYWVGGRIEQWVDRLEARLGGRTTHRGPPGELAAAHAQAEEIRRSPPYEHWLTVDRYLAGRGWLEEACLVAQSEPVRLRAYRELTARLTAEERLDAAQRMLEDAARRCPAPSRRRRWLSGAENWTASATRWKHVERSRRPRPKTPTARDCARVTSEPWTPAMRRPRRATRSCFPPPVPARSDRREKKK